MHQISSEKMRQINLIIEEYPDLLDGNDEETCLAAIREAPLALCLVEPQTERLCLEAVKLDGELLFVVEERLRTPEICMAAVRQNGCAIYWAPVQTPELALAAVRQNGRALRYVDPPLRTLEIINAAIEQNPEAARFIDSKPHPRPKPVL